MRSQTPWSSETGAIRSFVPVPSQTPPAANDTRAVKELLPAGPPSGGGVRKKIQDPSTGAATPCAIAVGIVPPRLKARTAIAARNTFRLRFICITSLPKFSDPGSQVSLFHFISVKRKGRVKTVVAAKFSADRFRIGV